VTEQRVSGPFQLAEFSHVGIVVRDLQGTIDALTRIWNIPTPPIANSADWPPIDPAAQKFFVGEPFQGRGASLKMGPVTVELLEPLEGTSPWAQSLAQHGEGLHHIAIRVSNYDDMVAHFLAEGHVLVASGIAVGDRWCYLRLVPGDLIIELQEHVRGG